jgi:hypothetical protein
MLCKKSNKICERPILAVNVFFVRYAFFFLFTNNQLLECLKSVLIHKKEDLYFFLTLSQVSSEHFQKLDTIIKYLLFIRGSSGIDLVYIPAVICWFFSKEKLRRCQFSNKIAFITTSHSV